MPAKDLTDYAVYGKVPREGQDPRLLVKQVRRMYALPSGQDFKLSLHSTGTYECCKTVSLTWLCRSPCMHVWSQHQGLA